MVRIPGARDVNIKRVSLGRKPPTSGLDCCPFPWKERSCELIPVAMMTGFCDLFGDSAGPKPEEDEATRMVGSESGETSEEFDHPDNSHGERPWQSEKDRKRMRAIKNRQAAHASRERKRRYLEELELNNRTLENESRTLRARVETLEHEKLELRTTLTTLQSDIEQLKQMILIRLTDIPQTPLDRPRMENTNLNPMTPLTTVPNQGKTAITCTNDKETELWTTSSGLPAITGPQSTHSPSVILDHLLVSVAEKKPALPGQPAPSPLSHVLRLRVRVRYSRPPSMSSLSVPREKSSVGTRGKRVSNGTPFLKQQHSKSTPRLQRKRPGRRHCKPIDRNALRMIWEQICQRRFSCPKQAP